MLHYLLFFIYFLLLVWVLRKNAIVKTSGFSHITLLLLFIVKISAGIAIGWISAEYYGQGNDYWTLHREGLLEYDLLIHHPIKFVTSIFDSPYDNKYGGFFDAVGSYWNDLKNNIIIKILAALNILSRGNFYINSLFLNAFSFLGTLALATLFYRISKSKLASLAACFCIPSALYFSSGIHKDLFVFTLLGFFLYALYNLIENFQNKKQWILLFISMLLLLIMRNIVLLLLIPSLIFLYFRYRCFNNLKSLLSTFAICLLSLFFLHFTSADPLKMIAQRQHDFFDLPVASSQMPLTKLEPHVQSFINVLPEAANHAFLRPYVWEYPGHFLIIPAIEWFCILVFIFIFFLRNKLPSIAPFYVASIIFAFLIILVAGFIVPNSGSLIRYRSLYLPYLVAPFLLIWLGKNRITK